MSLASRCWKWALVSLVAWACAKVEDSALVGNPDVPSKGGSGGASGRGGSGGTGGSSAGKGGTQSTVGGAAGTANAGSGGAGRGGGGGSAGLGEGGAPGCGETTARGITLYYRVGNATASSSQVFMHLYFQNAADTALDLATVTVHYFMTAEPTAFNNPVTDYSGGQVSGPRAVYVDDGEYSHLSITFGGGQIPPHNTDLNPTEVQFRIEAQNGQRFDQSNDYSFAPSFTDKTPHDRITVYVDGQLAWGREPSGRCPGEGQGGQGGEGGEPATGGASGTNAGGEGGMSGAPDS